MTPLSTLYHRLSLLDPHFLSTLYWPEVGWPPQKDTSASPSPSTRVSPPLVLRFKYPTVTSTSSGGQDDDTYHPIAETSWKGSAARSTSGEYLMSGAIRSETPQGLPNPRGLGPANLSFPDNHPSNEIVSIDPETGAFTEQRLVDYLMRGPNRKPPGSVIGIEDFISGHFFQSKASSTENFGNNDHQPTISIDPETGAFTEQRLVDYLMRGPNRKPPGSVIGIEDFISGHFFQSKASSTENLENNDHQLTAADRLTDADIRKMFDILSACCQNFLLISQLMDLFTMNARKYGTAFPQQSWATKEL